MTLVGAAAAIVNVVLRVAIRAWQLLLAPVLPPSCRF